jgi:pilus assembly protein FimV
VRLGLLGSSLTWASYSFALGLGEIDLDSSLNERFKAQIEVLDADDLERSEILVSLASSEDFSRVGVERFFYLTDLRFEVVKTAGGQTAISVSSSQPVSEPYLNFLVELHWPNGRMLKEYTVLMDPPTFTQIAAPAANRASQAPAPQSQAGPLQRPPAPTPSPRVESPASAASPAADSSQGTRLNLNTDQPRRSTDAGGSGYYRMTDRNDTLWNIAEETLPSDQVSVQQNMLALQRLNPKAFIRGNINLMKAGYVLRLPTESDALQMTSSEARAEARAQTAEWRAYSRGERVADSTQATPLIEEDSATLRAQVDATETGAENGGAAEAQPEAAATDGQLRIVATDADTTVGTVSSIGPVPGSSGSLEEADRLSREIEALSEELQRSSTLAATQIETLDRQIELKDRQIAELQARLAEQANTPVASTAPQNQAQAAKPWWNSPLVIGGGFAALVLAIVGGLMGRRRRSQDDEPAPAIAPDRVKAAISPAPVEEQARAEEDEATAIIPAMDDSADIYPHESADTEQAAESEHEEPDSQTSDVVGEAEIYIAYGRYPQAISLLRGVLDTDPARNDVRIKLMDIYSETGERDAFDAEMEALMANTDDQEVLLTAQEFAARFVNTGSSADGSTSDALEIGMDAETGETEPEASISGIRQSDTDAGSADDLDIADLENDLNELDSLVDDKPMDAGLDFDLQLDDDLLEDEKERAQMNFDRDLPMKEDSSGNVGATEEGTEGFTNENAEDEESHEIADGFDLEDLSFTGDDVDEIESFESDDDFDFEDDADSSSTKLDLARAYIDMGDKDGARDILQEVLSEGSEEQQGQAETLLEKL